jgi:hypothetical protein
MAAPKLDKAAQDTIDAINQSATTSAAITAATTTAQGLIAAANMTNQLANAKLAVMVESTRGVVSSVKDAAKDGTDAIKKP